MPLGPNAVLDSLYDNDVIMSSCGKIPQVCHNHQAEALNTDKILFNTFIDICCYMCAQFCN